jgi:hypothetical protein
MSNVRWRPSDRLCDRCFPGSVKNCAAHPAVFGHVNGPLGAPTVLR